eukprot:scaffold272047_cov20-Prasinocladus_malaysianus.AAC.1
MPAETIVTDRLLPRFSPGKCEIEDSHQLCSTDLPDACQLEYGPAYVNYGTTGRLDERLRPCSIIG